LGGFLVVGGWLLVVGCWLLVVGCWLLVVGCWLLVVGCWVLVVGCWLLVVGCWLLVVGCWLLVVGCWLLVGDDPTGIFLLSGLEDNDVKSFHCCRVVGSASLAYLNRPPSPSVAEEQDWRVGLLSNLYIIFLSIFWIIKFKTLLLSRNLKQMPGIRIIFSVL